MNRAPSTRKAAAGLGQVWTRAQGCSLGADAVIGREGPEESQPLGRGPSGTAFLSSPSPPTQQARCPGPSPSQVSLPPMPSYRASSQPALTRPCGLARGSISAPGSQSSPTAPLPSRDPRASPGHCTGVTAQPRSRACRRSPSLASRDVRGQGGAVNRGLKVPVLQVSRGSSSPSDTEAGVRTRSS